MGFVLLFAAVKILHTSVQNQHSVSSQFQALLLNNEKCTDDF